MHKQSPLPQGSYPFEVEVKDDHGATWTARQKVNLLSRKPPILVPGKNWPMFMGNSQHTGYTSESIDILPLKLAWTADTGGDPDFASPIIVKGMLYITLKKRTRARTNGVAAFNPVTGKHIWLFETSMAINHTPAYAEGILCIAEMGGRIYGLNAATGQKQWQHDLIDSLGRYNYCAPAVNDGWFYAGVMRRLAKIRAATGAIKWEKQIGATDNDWISSYGSPAVSNNYLAMGGMFFGGDGLVVARADDGSRIWAHSADAGLLGSPTIAGNRVLFTSMKSILYCNQLNDGKPIWKQELGDKSKDANWSATTPAVKLTGESTGIVVAGSGDGRMSGINLDDGKILWTHISDSTVFKVSPYRRDDRPLLSSPTIANDKVFFGSADGHIYCLDLITGKELWSFFIGVSVMSTPLVTGNAVYVAAYDGRLYAFTTGTDK